MAKKKPAPKDISKVSAPSTQTHQCAPASDSPISSDSNTPIVSEASTKEDYSYQHEHHDSRTSTPSATSDSQKNPGNVPDIVESAELPGIAGDVTIGLVPPRVNPGETRKLYWERLRKFARVAGMPKGQGPGTAYAWATETADPIYDEYRAEQQAQKAAEEAAEAAEAAEEETIDPEPDQDCRQLATDLATDEPEICRQLATNPSEETQEKIGSAQQPENQNGGVSGLGEIPASWPELPANAPLQVEIAWVSANRLKVRSGTGVDLSRALSPAPSYSALSWLETSILFPAKFADISVKASADNDSEKEFIKREKLAIEEIRSILREMLEAGGEDDGD